MNFYQYFQSYDNYFWQWEDNGEVLAIPGESTIAYRAFIGDVYQKIIPQGIPPFGSLLLTIIATNPDSKESLVAVNRMLQKLMTENERAFVDRVFTFLHILSQVPKEYKIGNKRIFLLQSIFQGCHNILSADNSKRIFSNYFSSTIDKPLLLRKEKFSSHVFVRDLRTLELIGQKLKTVDDIIDKIAGLPELTEQIEIPTSVEESAKPKDFVEELMDHTKTFYVGSLIKRLWSGLNIPVHASQPSEQPIGGISDLTNKGDFDKLLLSEFANDDLVFLSRLANNEALYIHREIPPINNDFQRVILIDVSLKNWGTPKTIAFAIMLAIAKHPKTTIESSVFVIGNGVQPVSIESIHTIIDGLELLETGLHAAKGLAAFFKEYPSAKNREVFVITTHSTLKQPEMLRTMNDYHSLVNYWIHADVDGHVDVYKKQQSSKKHLQHFQLPLKELWTREVKRPTTVPKKRTQEETQNPLLYRNSTSSKKILSAPDGEIFQITGDKRVLKFYDKSSHSYHKGWELMHKGLPPTVVEYEIGMKNGEYILLMFSSQNKEIFLLNMHTRDLKSFPFTIWRKASQHRFVFVDGSFYCHNSVDQCSIGLDGKTEKSKINVEIFKEREDELTNISKKFSYAQHHFKNVGQVFINETNHLVFNIHELLLNPGHHIKLEGKAKHTKMYEARYMNTGVFEFAEGSKVEIDPAGVIILKSSNDSIPIIYIPSYLDSALGIATNESFAGNDYYYADAKVKLTLKSFTTAPLELVKLIKSYTPIGLKEAKEIVDGGQSVLLASCHESKGKEIQKIFENHGAIVEMSHLGGPSGSLSGLEKITTVEFYNKYIDAFVENITRKY